MKILIATDGSKYGTAALEQACELAANLPHSEVKIVTAYELPGPIAVEPYVAAPVYTQEVVDNLCTAAAEVLTSARRTVVRNCPGVPVNTSERRCRAATAIVEEAKEWGADLIVIGSHGHGFWGRTLLGSVSDAVVHSAPCSVMVARISEV